jgi:hypothetical protein
MRLALRLLIVSSVLAPSLTVAAPDAAASAQVILVNINAAGVGLNDPTPVAPVGGNTGTTLGQQRMNALRRAADIWGATLDSPVPIRIEVVFAARSCTATTATLASSGALWVDLNFPSVAGFPGPVAPDVWHHGALANKRAGAPLAGETQDDLRSIFNINLGAANCLAGSPFYLGLDGNEGSGVDLVATALHEFGHGLGFSQFADVANGAQFLGFPDVYSRKLLDTTAGSTWDQMTDAQRAASAINVRHLVWNGAEVTAAAPSVLQVGTPVLQVQAPAAIAAAYQVGTAAFGPALGAAGITGDVVVGIDPADAAGATTTDACSPLTNAAAVAGRIALVDRGTCGFIVKVKNAQNAGAIAVLVADNAAGSPPAGLGGTDPTIVIPSVRISLADGNTIKNSLTSGAVNVTLGLDLSLLSGADSERRVFINTPDPVVPGSSVSHWDPLAARNLLMEPNINNDLTHSLQPPDDLTLPQMRDIGWFPDSDNDGIETARDACPGAYDARAKVVVGGTDTGIGNLLFTNGCTIQDLVNLAAAAADNHGAFVSSVTQLINVLRNVGIISNDERQAIHRAAVHSSEGK